MIKADLHVHTEFSCDSEARISDYIVKAKEIDINYICFTDHVDFNENDNGYGYYLRDMFFQSFNQCKEKENNVELASGIEFSEPHLYFDKLNQLTKFPYDFVIGSIHWIGDMFPCQKVRQKYSAKEFYSLYWKEVLKTAKRGGFDCLGHIDFPKRYYGEIYYEDKILNEIFRYLIEQDIVIEINTSSLRKGMTETMPYKELLEIYKDNGGQFITIGSDAHEVKDLGADHFIAKALVKEFQFQEVIYRERKKIVID